MANRVLRDHSGKCVHGVKMYCGNVIAETGERCPGGREVTARPMVETSHLADTFHGASNGDRIDGWLIPDG